MAPVAVPKLLPGAFLMALGLLAYWQFGLSRMRGWPLIALIGVSLVSFAYGLRLLWTWVDELPPKPHEVVSSNSFGTPLLVVAYVFLGGPALFVFLAAASNVRTHSGESLWWPALVVGGAAGMILLALTSFWLRHRRYGFSTCRLRGPARAGGWLEAHIECALPQSADDMVVIRLFNYSATHRSTTPVWQMEERLQVPAQGERTVLHLRLAIPRAREQRVHRGGAGLWARLFSPTWVLEIQKEADGIDFHAKFTIPVFDAADPLAEMPLPRSPQPAGDSIKRRTATLLTAAGISAICIATYQAGQRGWLSTGVFAPSSEWLSRPRFQREFDVWSASHYPSSIQGRCAEGQELYRADWEPLPYGARFYSWYGMDRATFEKRGREYGVHGYRLEGGTQFSDCRGVERFQGTWLRRMLAN